MDYFTDLLAMFLDLDRVKDPCCLWRDWEVSDSINNIFICVPKMNGGFMSLEQYEGEKLMT